MTSAESAQPLGSKNVVLAVLRGQFPDLDATHPLGMIHRTSAYSLAFGIVEAEGQVWCVCVNVHGVGDPAQILGHLCRETGWQAFDSSEGAILRFAGRQE
jgi:hypothetical protein